MVLNFQKKEKDIKGCQSGGMTNSKNRNVIQEIGQWKHG
jgi:hypothetical protein